jgi:hypothetical protein
MQRTGEPRTPSRADRHDHAVVQQPGSAAKGNTPLVRLDRFQRRDTQLRATLSGDRGKIEQTRLCQAERLRYRQRLVNEAAVRSDQVHTGSAPEKRAQSQKRLDRRDPATTDSDAHPASDPMSPLLWRCSNSLAPFHDAGW